MIERKRGNCLIIMNTTTIEQACNPSNWKWKRWDVRSDGKVFWEYQKNHLNVEYWITWDSAFKYKDYYRLYKKPYDDLYRKTKKHKDYQKSYRKSRILSDPIFATKYRLRCRISEVIRAKGYSKTSKTNKMLGCDWSHLKVHLESKFADGMSWENRNLWHIDHVIPLASAKSVEEVVKLCHYTNLQPLWAKDNLSKGAKILT